VGEPARLSLKVRHYEVDLYGHVNHANYVHYLEAGRIEALEAVGMALPEMRRQGYLLVAVELAVKYHAPAHSGDTLEIRTHIREIRGARSVWVQEIRDAASRRLAVTAEVTGAFMTENGRPVRVPAAFVEKLSALHVADDRPAAPREDPGAPPRRRA
jgi:YbgC/YbaW family acyl-CoA thioester hydrolase